MILQLCAWLNATSFSVALRESTWGYPVLAAVHVLGLAWFGGALLAGHKRLRRIGLAFLLATGFLVFAVEPLRCYHSTPFRLKLLLIGAAVLSPRLTGLLWIGVVFASRAIGYF